MHDINQEEVIEVIQDPKSFDGENSLEEHAHRSGIRDSDQPLFLNSNF